MTREAPPRRQPGIPAVPLRADPESVALARRFVTDVISGHVHDPGHTHAVRLAVSELTTNAIAAADAYATARAFIWSQWSWPVRVAVHATDRCVHLQVEDPDPAPPVRGVHGLMDEHGRGLDIVEVLAEAVWPECAGDHKVMHAVIAAPGVTLTPAELGGR